MKDTEISTGNQQDEQCYVIIFLNLVFSVCCEEAEKTYFLANNMHSVCFWGEKKKWRTKHKLAKLEGEMGKGFFKELPETKKELLRLSNLELSACWPKIQALGLEIEFLIHSCLKAMSPWSYTLWRSRMSRRPCQCTWKVTWLS